MSESTEQRVIAVVCAKTGASRDRVTSKTSLEKDLHIDELARMELVMDLEKAFGTQIPDEYSDRFKTVGDVIKFIETRGR